MDCPQEAAHFSQMKVESELFSRVYGGLETSSDTGDPMTTSKSTEIYALALTQPAKGIINRGARISSNRNGV